MTQALPEPRVFPDLQRSPIFVFKGLRDMLSYPQPELTQEHSVDMSNIDLSEQRLARRRSGYEKFNTSQISGTPPITGFIQHEIGTHGLRNVYTSSTKIYADTGSTRTDLTGSVTLNAGAEARHRFAYLDSTLIAVNGTNNIWTWNGNTSSTAAALTTAPVAIATCEDVIVHKNVLLYVAPTISSTKYPTRLYWCDVDTDTFGVDIDRVLDNNRFEVDAGGTDIIGAASAWDKVFIFKKDGVYVGEVVYHVGALEYTPLSTMKGFSPVSKSSIIVRPEFIFGIATEGAFIITPDMQYRVVTRDINFQSLFNLGRLQYSVSTVREKDHQVRVLMSSDTNTTGHDRVLVWDWETQELQIESYTAKMNHVGTMFVSNTEFDFLGSYDTGYVYKGNVGTQDDGTDFSYTYETAPNDLGLPGIAKIIKTVILYYKNTGKLTTLTCQVKRDQGVRGTKSKSFSFGTDYVYNGSYTYNSGIKYPDDSANKVTFAINRTVENLSLIITGSNAAELIGYQVEYSISGQGVL